MAEGIFCSSFCENLPLDPQLSFRPWAVQVSALYQQCIKLATENKITSKNTWSLGLIDHLHDLVQPNDLEGNATNFQRASLTLGAGVEIYAKRVDSVHAEAYKVMGSLSRAGAAAPEDQGEGDPGKTLDWMFV